MLALLLLLGFQQPSDVLVLRDVTVVDVEHGRLEPGRSLRIRAGRIERVGTRAEIEAPPGAQVVDGAGRFLLPGLVDAHVHLNEPDDPGDLWLYLANGVTTIRSMHGGTHQLRLRERVRAGALVGPRIVTTGPTTARLKVHTVEQARQTAREQAAAGYDAIKMYGDGSDTMPRETYHALIESAHAAGLPVLGHAPRNLPFSAVLEEHQDSIDHMEEIVYTDEGLGRLVAPYVAIQFGRTSLANRPEAQRTVPDFAAELGPEIEALTARVKAAGLVVTPTLTTFATIQATTDDGLFALLERPELRYADPVRRREWTPEHARFRNGRWSEDLPFMAAYLRAHADLQRALLRAFHEAGVPILTGADTPFDFLVPGFGLHRELAEFVGAGLTPLEALRCATTTPARVMKLAESGTIAAGQRADLVLVARDPLQDIAAAGEVEGLVLAGRWIPGATLAAELERIAAAKVRLAPLIDGLGAALDAGDTARAVELYESAGEARAGLASTLESGLNELGYRQLRSGRPEEAHATFQRNVTLFPASHNAWDSLGEALWKLDRDEEAIAAYEHALELEPGFANARTMLERILAED